VSRPRLADENVGKNDDLASFDQMEGGNFINTPPRPQPAGRQAVKRRRTSRSSPPYPTPRIATSNTRVATRQLVLACRGAQMRL
jgi:hypothetical protein